ncbi:hypothetical protein [Sphingopyxis sp. GW247-27LB]|nr:hypothetical protein [Sphingopyxis sp. GW247-27LB]
MSDLITLFRDIFMTIGTIATGLTLLWLAALVVQVCRAILR